MYYFKAKKEMKKYIIENLESIPNIAKKFIEENSENKVFAFYGEMGVGKTTFIKELCKTLGTNENVTSPTFAIVNEYETKHNGIIFHFDFYRIESIEEAYDIGFEDYLYQNNYSFIEWPERIENLLPENYIRVNITENENGNRLINVS